MNRQIAFFLPALLLINFALISCQPKIMDINTPTSEVIPSIVMIPKETSADIDINPDFTRFLFPTTISAYTKYLIYLHGKIIEDQGIPAVSPEFGEYEYQAILEKLESYGFTVISEPRAKNTDGLDYGKRVSDQIRKLLDAGVPPENISVIGASKGGGIAIYVSHLLDNPKIQYVIMAICSPEEISRLKESGITLTGKVLSIYDSADTLAGSCMDLFEFSKGEGLSDSKEIVLNLGIGHGILYKPLDDWMQPAVEWVQIK
jgi:hypothetical protein